MKILYLGISSKYIHTMPAGWFLAEYLLSKGIPIDELYHNVNEPYDDILNDVIDSEADMLLLSIYIFNVELIKRLIRDLRSRLPQCKIVAGGPEVTDDFDADHIIMGEGEQALYDYSRRRQDYRRDID